MGLKGSYKNDQPGIEIILELQVGWRDGVVRKTSNHSHKYKYLIHLFILYSLSTSGNYHMQY